MKNGQKPNIVALERALRESEAKFRTLTESAAVGIFLYREKFIYANPALQKITGYSLEELSNLYCWDVVHPEHRDMVRRRILARLAGENPPHHYEIKIITKKGAERWLEVTAATFDQEGQVIGVGTAIDVTEKKIFAKGLEETVARYQAIFDAFEGLIYAIRPDYRIAFLNKKLRSRLGEDPLPSRCFEALYGRQEPCPWCPRDEVLRGEVVQREFPQAIEGRWYRMVSTPLHYPPGELQILNLVEDVTERKKAQEELLRASKLESLGLLAGGIAHDFNNFLTAILGSLTLIRLKSEQEELRKLARLAEQACLKARGLTHQLLTFAKGGAPAKKTSELKDLLEETVSFCLRGSNVAWTLDIAADLALVDVDPTQFSQVISNLVINAKQAMLRGGKLLIKAENVVLNGQSHGLPPGDYVKIVIQDEGEGIPLEILPKIFDPYFTTKEKGSGLGLAVSYSIVKSHGGHIEVSSEVGRGTTFEIYLPVSKGRAQREPQPSQVLPRGTARVLILDDEELIRKTLREALEFAGYKVEEACTGEEAVERVKEALPEKPFEVAILDLTVRGGLGGREILPVLKEVDPRLKTVLISGYASLTPEEYRRLGFDAILKKPFTVEELLVILKEFLGHA